MAIHQAGLGASRFKISALILALVLVTASVMLPASVEGSGTALCCSDEWQGGGACTEPGQRIASYCADSSCQSCGAFFCYTETIHTACYH
jgi:hypothetical protein